MTWQVGCSECIVDHPPSTEAPGQWYLSILGITLRINFQVNVILPPSITFVDLILPPINSYFHSTP